MPEKCLWYLSMSLFSLFRLCSIKKVLSVLNMVCDGWWLTNRQNGDGGE